MVGSCTSQSKKHTILKNGCKNESRTSKACLEALVISLKITLALVDGEGERECAATSHNFFSGYTTRRAICFRNKSLRYLCDRLFDALSKCHNMLGLNLLHMCPFQFPVSVSRISFLSSRKKDGTRNKTIVIV